VKRNSRRLNVGLWRIWPGGPALPTQAELENTATPAGSLTPAPSPAVSPPPGHQPVPPQPISSDPAAKSKPKIHALAAA
jgi:hypothetical protein